jgi:hypothetical protein
MTELFEKKSAEAYTENASAAEFPNTGLTHELLSPLDFWRKATTFNSTAFVEERTTSTGNCGRRGRVCPLFLAGNAHPELGDKTRKTSKD